MYNEMWSANRRRAGLAKERQINNCPDSLRGYYEGSIPEAVTVADKPELEKLRLIEQLDEDDKATIFSLVEKMLTNKKFKDFFAKNVASL